MALDLAAMRGGRAAISGGTAPDRSPRPPAAGRLMAFGDHVPATLSVAWLGTALAIDGGAIWQGRPDFLLAGLTVAAPALVPPAFALLYIALWIVSRETGWPGRTARRSFPVLAFWLLVAGLPGLLSFPIALIAAANATPLFPTGLEGSDLSTLLRRGAAGTFLLVMLPVACASATAAALWLCAKRLLDRRRTARPELPLAKDLGIVSPTLAIGFLLFVVLALAAGFLASGPPGMAVGAVLPPSLIGAPLLALVVSPLLAPVVLPMVLIFYRCHRKDRKRPGGRLPPPGTKPANGPSPRAPGVRPTAWRESVSFRAPALPADS